jgi:hypothetical protein
MSLVCSRILNLNHHYSFPRAVRRGRHTSQTTMASTSIYHTPASSFAGHRLSSPSSFTPSSSVETVTGISTSTTPPNPSPLSSGVPLRQTSSSPAAPIDGPSSSVSSFGNHDRYPSIYINHDGANGDNNGKRQQEAPDDATTTTKKVLPDIDDGEGDHPWGSSDGVKLFFSSAKTGESVEEVFEYVARRVAGRLEWEDKHGLRGALGGFSLVDVEEEHPGAGGETATNGSAGRARRNGSASSSRRMWVDGRDSGRDGKQAWRPGCC